MFVISSFEVDSSSPASTRVVLGHFIGEVLCSVVLQAVFFNYFELRTALFLR